MSLGERLIIPAVLTILFALLSLGAMFGTGGDARRMKIVLRCAIVFVVGMTYSMAWHDVLARVFRWEQAWIATTILSGVVGVLLGRRWFAKGAGDDSSVERTGK
jgi:hypothetical protein